jgi:hypothetical protein
LIDFRIWEHFGKLDSVLSVLFLTDGGQSAGFNRTVRHRGFCWAISFLIADGPVVRPGRSADDFLRQVQSGFCSCFSFALLFLFVPVPCSAAHRVSGKQRQAGSRR